MTRDDIIKIAREAGFRAGHIKLGNSDPLPFVAPCSAMDCLPELVRFANLVAAAERTACARHFEVAMRNAVTAEREVCAKVCEEIAADRWALYKGREPYTGSEDGRACQQTQGESIGAEDCATAIRARGES